MLDRVRFLLLILSVLLFSGCGSIDTGTPVFSIGETSNRYHVVQRGDTLYSIAWRYGLDYKDLAAINGISPPYTIYVDQKIRLAKSSRARAEPRTEQKDGPPPSDKVTTPPSPSAPTRIETATLPDGAIQ
ncbi:MAG: LysM peptidoglycan-binding domain-containing protein, partial [Pseudomonadales bacterium]|nr:LysM peptidoglycan-binding domain-containing protein [Pseudomonadales bacterium]